MFMKEIKEFKMDFKGSCQFKVDHSSQAFET